MRVINYLTRPNCVPRKVVWWAVRTLNLSTTCRWITCFRQRLKCDGTRAETRFRLSAKRTNPFKSAGERQFSRLLTSELYASAIVMLDTSCSEVVWRVLATHCIRQFPLHFPSLRHRVPSHFNWSLPSISVRPYPCLTTSGTHITSLLRPMILPSVSCLALQNVPHYLINGTIFARTHTHTHTHTHTQSQTSVHELNSFLKVVRKPKFS